MSILSINRDVLGQFSHRRCLLFLSISFFSLFFPKPSLFPHTTKLVLEKWWSRIHSPLDRHDISESGSKLIFKHSHHWELWKMSELREKPFLSQRFIFPQKPKTVSVKLRSRTFQPLDCCEILIWGSRFISTCFHRCDFQIIVFEGRNTHHT